MPSPSTRDCQDRPFVSSSPFSTTVEACHAEIVLNSAIVSIIVQVAAGKAALRSPGPTPALGQVRAAGLLIRATGPQALEGHA